MAKKVKYEMYTTPRGVLIYPHLTEPDTKYVKDGGEYHTKFALPSDSPETEAFLAKLEEVRQKYLEDNPDDLKPAVLKKAKMAEFGEEELDDEGSETGRLIFKLKLKAVVKTDKKSWEQKPRLFDSGDPTAGIAPQPIEGDISIWTGTEAKCRVELFPYFMQSTKECGVSLRVKGVQILKLVSGGGASAGDMGFDAEEDGYMADSGMSGNDFDGGADSASDDEF